jgi:hypothetical protein
MSEPPIRNRKLGAFQHEAMREYAFAKIHDDICATLEATHEQDDQTVARSFLRDLWCWSCFQRHLALARLFEPPGREVASIPAAVQWLGQIRYEIDVLGQRGHAAACARQGYAKTDSREVWSAFGRRLRRERRNIDALVSYRSKVLVHTLTRQGPETRVPTGYDVETAKRINLPALFKLGLDFLDLCQGFTVHVHVWEGKLAIPGHSRTVRSLCAMLDVLRRAGQGRIDDVSQEEREIMADVLARAEREYDYRIGKFEVLDRGNASRR